MKYLVPLLVLSCGACGVQVPQAGEPRPRAALPADVRAFVERRDGCDHFRGEDPYDGARAKEIQVQTARLCTGTDAELARLKRAYVGDRAVLNALSGYEAKVE